MKGDFIMPTSRIFKENLKNGIITSDMLSDCIFSVNKRAKNFRDREADIRAERRFNPYFCDKYDNEGTYRTKKRRVLYNER